ncbi:MAG: HEAT repeat domain-containing protein [Pedobacter sp.]|nr:MAG: HEAT repeat domain-containing protein [Pedobacter sp.]
MERDFFKQYIQEHKDAFENEALPPNMLGNILGNLKEREEHKKLQVQKKRKLTYTWLAVACSLFMLAGTYLFLSQETAEIKQTRSQIATNSTDVTEQPVISKIEELSLVEKSIRKPLKHLANYQPKVDPYQEIYTGLEDSLSVASRLDAIIKSGSLLSLNDKLKTALCKTFDNDDNDNVRLAALEVLSKFSNDKYIQEQLMAGLGKEKDPVVQLELIKIMGNNSTPEATNKLIAMANNPFTVEAVKEQVYYALLTNNN